MTPNKMTIRQLLLSLLALLGLLTLAGSLWEGMSVRQTLRQAQWMAGTHSIADTSLRASAALAQERGITAAILGNPANATTSMRNDMASLRHTVDTAYDELIAFGAALPRLNGGHPLPANLQSLSAQREALASVRNRIDRQLQGDEAVITIQEWISAASDHPLQYYGQPAPDAAMGPGHDDR